MKYTICLLLVLSSFVSNAHEYFFGYAEIEYNEISEKIEGTLVVTTHDLEDYLKKEYNISNTLDKLDSLELITLNKVIKRKLITRFDKEQAVYTIIGIEAMLNGAAQIYIESQKLKLPNTISFEFILLMDLFEQQQNKITFKYRDQEFNLTFVGSETKRTIQLQ